MKVNCSIKSQLWNDELIEETEFEIEPSEVMKTNPRTQEANNQALSSGYPTSTKLDGKQSTIFRSQITNVLE